MERKKSFEKKEKSTLPSYGMYYGKAKGFWHQEKGGREDDGRNRAHSIIKDWITPANWKKGGGRREGGGKKRPIRLPFSFAPSIFSSSVLDRQETGAARNFCSCFPPI